MCNNGIKLELFDEEESLERELKDAFPLEVMVLEFAYLCGSDNPGAVSDHGLFRDEVFEFARHNNNLQG